MVESVWFSHKEYRYEEGLKENQKIFRWTEQPEMWDWDNCTISVVKISNEKVKVIVRSSHTVSSEYKKSSVKLRYILGFDVVNTIGEPYTEDYHEPPPGNVKGKVYGSTRPRWVIKLENENYFIWQWAEDGKTIENSNVYKIYLILKKEQESTFSDKPEIFDVPTQDDDRVIPAVYQPALDSWKNFVREIHCHKINEKELEVSILFNNEELREHALLNPIYRWIRSLLYGRTLDLETFRVPWNNAIPENFRFGGIYSGQNDIQKDDIHEDKPDISGNVPLHHVKYYFANAKHPIVFINTSNHAMAEFDTNQRLWKWEYVAWEKDSPIIYGTKSRKEIDNSFKPKIKFW